MKQDYHQLLQAKIINSVAGLALISRVIVDGYLSGLNRSRRVGSGLEFSQYRGYEPGDDLRLLDWKMLARSGRYYLKQSEVETHIAVKFILDSSKSMLHTEEGISKMDYAKVVIASLAYLAQSQGDAVGLFALNDKQLQSIYPTVKKQHYKRLLLELTKVQSQGKWPGDQEASQKLHDRSHKELIFFVTDMYEYNEELTQFIKRLKTVRNEVVVLQIMGNHELEFDYKGYVIFEDLETGTKLKVETSAAKKEYLSSLETMMAKVRNELLSEGISYELFKLNDKIEEVLNLFLKRRNKLL
ncbi:DUF58 domain-containing protein [Lutimonas sp.]|uniref:DUF58 domain-containing protein n=1 Tax=Lutimonas sp. TaxID=1872403 RepID=UPI003C73533E